MDKKEELIMEILKENKELTYNEAKKEIDNLFDRVWNETLVKLKEEPVFIKKRDSINAYIGVFKGASKEQIKNAILDFYGDDELYVILITNEEDSDLGYVFDLYLVKPDIYLKKRNVIDSFDKKLNEVVDYIYDVTTDNFGE